MKTKYFIYLFLTLTIDAFSQVQSIQFTGSAPDFFIDAEPNSYILRTRNWNISNPNIAATGIHTGKGIFETDLSVGNNLIINGRLGIGINIPSRQLDIIGTAVNGDYTSLLRVGTNGSAYGNSGGGIEFAAFNNSGQINAVGVIAASLTDGTANHQTGNLRFLVSNNGILKERMVLNSNGQLNITGSATSGNYTTLLRIGTDGSAFGGSGGGIEFAAFNNNGQTNTVGVIAASLTDGTANHQTGDLRFLVSYSGSLQEKMRLSSSGNLDVNGTIHTKEVKVDLIGWSDFVFKSTYKLKSLSDLEYFINQNGHLPEIPSESEVKTDGVNLGEIQAKLLQKN